MILKSEYLRGSSWIERQIELYRTSTNWIIWQEIIKDLGKGYIKNIHTDKDPIVHQSVITMVYAGSKRNVQHTIRTHWISSNHRYLKIHSLSSSHQLLPIPRPIRYISKNSPSCGGNGVRLCMRGGGTERDRLSEWQQKTKRGHTSYPQYLGKEKNQSFLNFLSTYLPDSVHGVTLMRCTSRFR